MKKRTDMDWSKHDVKEDHSENCKIWEIALQNNDSTHLVRFINAKGTMMVNGDFGNWVFSREFHPGGDRVSDGYWIEKLQIASKQKPKHFDSLASENAINEFIKERITEGDYLTDEEQEYLEKLLSNVDDECEYTARVFRDHPSDWDSDSASRFYVETADIWLLYIFDAFDEITRRIKESRES